MSQKGSMCPKEMHILVSALENSGFFTKKRITEIWEDPSFIDDLFILISDENEEYEVSPTGNKTYHRRQNYAPPLQVA
ncbi:hypothetical protein EXS45_00585 [Candidatus Nomurabacteria bacterium]|nr:hypothetical protein [Candidatus Nomurabacteria bacterium]